MTITKDLVGFFGAVGDGSANDSPKWADFQAWAATQDPNEPIELTSPSGKNFRFGSPIGNGCIFDGIKDFTLNLNGSTLTPTVDGGFHFGSPFGVYGNSLHQARTATVAAGATSVQLLTDAFVASLADGAALFTLGQYALMTGFCPQEDGSPPNLRYFDYVLVSAIDAVNGIISFSTTPLKNSYKSTWPYYGPRLSGTDPGGPATLYALNPNWHLTHAYRDFNIANLDAANSLGMDVTFESVNVALISGHQGMFPTMSKNWSFINGSMDYSPEIDKLIDRCNLINSQFHGLDIQSSSINQLRIDRVTLTGGMVGAGIDTIVTNSSMQQLRPGAYNYGASKRFICIDTSFTSLVMGGILHKGSTESGVNVDYTMTGGVIRVPNTVPAADDWMVPGPKFWSGTDATEGVFFVEDVTQDATYTYAHTNLAGTFPDVALTGGKLYIQVPPAEGAVFRRCVGCADAIDVSQGTPGKPQWSYSRRDYTKADTASTPPSMPVYGDIVSITVTVHTAYAGATNPLTLGLNMAITKPDGSRVLYQPTINLRVAGTRVITAAGVTGAQSGDDLALPSGVSNWSGGGVNPSFSANVSGDATSMSVEIEVEADQGFEGQRTYVVGFV